QAEKAGHDLKEELRVRVSDESRAQKQTSGYQNDERSAEGFSCRRSSGCGVGRNGRRRVGFVSAQRQQGHEQNCDATQKESQQEREDQYEFAAAKSENCQHRLEVYGFHSTRYRRKTGGRLQGIWRTPLVSQSREKIADFFLHLVRPGHGVGDFIAQQL